MQDTSTVSYRFRKENSPDDAQREEVVANYVRDLTSGFDSSLQPLSVTPRDRTNTKWILITGATGGLGAHLVAEAAVRPDVERVICLNRRSKLDAYDRQLSALSKKGISLPPSALAKLSIHETDLSAPTNLGLPEAVYADLVSNTTHIIHNAWLMHSKWPVKRFLPQLQIMSHLLHFSACASNPISFIFISSIATIGFHPYLTSSPIIPEARVPIASVLPTGYGDAKYICERMLDATLHRHPERFRAGVVRLGQIAGSSINGHWNPMEHVSFMIKSSQTLGALPDLPGTMAWTPSDVIARSVVEISAQNNLLPVYHIENPVRQPWAHVLDVLADELGIERRVSLAEWAREVREWPRKQDNGPEGANPAWLLADFVEDHFVRMSCGGVLMATRNAREHSATMAGVGAVEEGLVRKYVRAWREMGFLK
jgi:thioester reductase-like protein